MVVVGDRPRRAEAGVRDGDPEALIEEARRRARRRRRRWWVVTAVLAAVGAAVGWIVSAGGASDGVVAQTASTPFVDVRAFAQAGKLAFISRGSLWVLDGAAGSLRRVPVSRGYAPRSPRLSADGRWLTFLAAAPNAEPSQLWIARGDGSRERLLATGVTALLGWRPGADVVAVTDAPQNRHAPFGSPTALELISPSGRVHRLMTLPTSDGWGGIDSATWSPDGSQIAVSFVGFKGRAGTGIRTYPLDGAHPTTWLAASSGRAIPGLPGRCSGPIADLAGWYRGWGIAFWSYACGMTHNNDQTPLDVIATPRAEPRHLADTLSDGVTDAITGSRTGQLALVANVAGALGREYGQGKAVELCPSATRNCLAVPGATVWNGAPLRCQKLPSGYAFCPSLRGPPRGTRGSGVTLDPAFSPDGSLLAYVNAPYWITMGNPAPVWDAEHRLDIYNTRTRATRRIAGIHGVSVPNWSHNARSLLYVSGDGLWLAPATGGRPVEIEHPLFTPAQWIGGPNVPPQDIVNYYGQIPWADQFSWASP